MLSFGRTDLAIELQSQIKEKCKGIKQKDNEYCEGNIKENIIYVKDEEAEKQLGKKRGIYITIENGNREDNHVLKMVTALLHERLKWMIGDCKKILVIGLGNRYVTPDALGPFTVDKLFITRHLIKEGIIDNKINLCAISPGVMGQTGIDSGIILKQICEYIKPDAVLAIDALAARDVHRLNNTIQLCDTGITPGSGVGNDRIEISYDTLKTKVIAIGIPTVISVHAIINGIVGEDVELSEEFNDFFVTPKNIDEEVRKMSCVISDAINMFLV